MSDLTPPTPTPAADDARAASLAEAMEKNPLLRRTDFRFPEDAVAQKVDAALQSQQGNVTLPGFRRGKVPLSVLRQRYGKDTLQEVIKKECEPKFAEELERSKERAAAAPQYQMQALVSDGAYHVECIYEVIPEITAPDFAGKTLKKPAFEVNDAAVQEMIDILRTQRGTHETLHGAAEQEGDRLLVDFSTALLAADGKTEEKVLESGSDRILPLGDENLHPDLLAVIKGSKAGDAHSVVLPMPAQHPSEEMRGRQVKMSLQVKSVQRLKKAEMNEAFFAQIIGEGRSEDDFRTEVRVHLQRERAVRLRNILHARAMSMLIEATPKFPLPQTMLHGECIRMMKDAQAQWEQRGMAETAAGLQPQMFQAEAGRRVALGLILSAWQRRENPEIGKELIDARLDEITRAYEDPAAAAAQMRASQSEMDGVYLSVLEDKVTDWICVQCGSVEEPMSLQAFFHEGGGFA